MTLPELLMAICFFTSLASAVGTAHYTKPGGGGYAIGTVLGLPLALAGASAIYVGVRKAAAVQARTKGMERLYLTVCLISLFVWALIWPGFTIWVISAALRVFA